MHEKSPASFRDSEKKWRRGLIARIFFTLAIPTAIGGEGLHMMHEDAKKMEASLRDDGMMRSLQDLTPEKPGSKEAAEDVLNRYDEWHTDAEAGTIINRLREILGTKAVDTFLDSKKNA